MSTVLSAMFAILIGIFSLPALLSLQHKAYEIVDTELMAQQARLFNDAALQFIRANSLAIQATATSHIAATVSVTDLKAAGFLPATFSATNRLGQTWQVEVLEPSPGNLQALAVTTGGVNLSDTHAARIAKLVGRSGGFFPKNDSGRYPGGASNAQGTAWGPLPATGYSGQPGHLASLLLVESGHLADNRLYRAALPGQPQLNTLSVPLIMDSVQVVGAQCSTIGAIARNATGMLLACRGIASSPIWSVAAESVFWGDPVASVASLPVNEAVGNVRLAGGRPYLWTGGSWGALAIDANGDMLIPGTVTALDGKVIFANEIGKGGVIRLVGHNGIGISLLSDNGTFQLIGDAGSASLFSIDNTGTTVGNRLTSGSTSQFGANLNTICNVEGSFTTGSDFKPYICKSGAWSKLGVPDWNDCWIVSDKSEGDGNREAVTCDADSLMVSYSVSGGRVVDCTDNSSVNAAAMTCSLVAELEVPRHLASAKCCAIL